MRYAANLLQDGTIQYNLGEKSDGITSGAYFLIMSGIALLFGNVLVVWKMASACFYAAAIGIFFWATSKNQKRLEVSALLASTLALEPHLLRWSATGMDNSLVAFVLCLGLLLHVTRTEGLRSSFAVGIFWGGLFLIRPELLLFSAAYIGLAMWSKRKEAVYMAAGALASAVTGVLLSYLATGFVVPETSSAKAIFLEQPLNWPFLRTLSLIIISGSTVSAVVALALARVSPRVAHWCVATFAFVLLVCAYLVYQHALVSTRYATSLSFPLLLAALYSVGEYLKSPRPPRMSRVLLASASLQMAAAALTLWYFFPFTRVSEEAPIREFSQSVNSRTMPGDRIALSEIGVFGFYSNRYIVDIFGLVDPKTLEWGREHGTPNTTELLEQLLMYRGADYYVCAFCKATTDVAGQKVRFEPVYSQSIRSGNQSKGRFVEDRLWVLYRLHY